MSTAGQAWNTQRVFRSRRAGPAARFSSRGTVRDAYYLIPRDGVADTTASNLPLFIYSSDIRT